MDEFINLFVSTVALKSFLRSSPKTVSVSHMAAAQPTHLPSIRKLFTSRTQSEQCGEAFPWGLHDVNHGSECLGSRPRCILSIGGAVWGSC